MKALRDPNKENMEPHEQANPIPRVVLGLVVALVFWAVVYIFSERADGIVYLGDRRDPSTLTIATSSNAISKTVDGAQVFAANCQACHQPNGQGLPGVFPPLAGSQWVRGDEALLKQILLHGLTGSVEVLGKSFNGSMPAFGAQLKDEEIAAVLTHIRSHWGNDAPKIDKSSVTSSRELSANRTTPWHGIDEINNFLNSTPPAHGTP